MKLKVSKSITNRIVNMTLETIEFTDEEKLMISTLGEPVIRFNKTYGEGAFIVAFERRIMSNFKIKLKLDGTADVDAADEASQLLVDDVKIMLEETMGELEIEYDTIKETHSTEEIIDIVY